MSMDLSKISTLTNIMTEDFTHNYHGRPYTIKAGESVTFPDDLSRHLAKHMARKILFSDRKPEELRNDRALFTNESETELMNRVLGEVSRREIPAELSESERIAQRVQELNVKKPEGAPEGRTKKDVIAELEAKDIAFDKRLSMQNLEELLKE